MQRTWTLLKDGQQVLEFTSFISADIQVGGEVVSEPVEEGSFATYNKILKPITISVTLGVHGLPETLQDFLDTLQEVQASTELFSLVTPESEFTDLSLESYSYTRTREEGVSCLYVNLNLVEVWQVGVEYTTVQISHKKAANAADGSTQNTGKTKSSETSKQKKQTLAKKFLNNLGF